MDSKTLLLLLAMATGGLIAMAFLNRPTSGTGGDNSSINIVGGTGNTYNFQPPTADQIIKKHPQQPAIIQMAHRLPHINNGDSATTQTSYTPGGY